MDSVGEVEGGMMWENGIETCKLSHAKLIASPSSMQGARGWCSGMTQRDGMGRGVQDGEHVYTRGRFMLMYGKNQYNIIK